MAITLRFENWHFPRPELAEAVLNSLQTFPPPRMVIVERRRVGKTSFLRLDVTPLAEKQGLRVVYADLWSDLANPVAALNHAWQTAFEQHTVAVSRSGRALQRPVNAVGALGVSVTLGGVVEPKEPSDPIFKLGYWFNRLLQLDHKPLLLLIDEFQALTKAKEPVRAIAALRSILQAQEDRVRVIFTGSSDGDLGRLFRDIRQPMYEFAQIKRLPLLGADFVQHCAERYHQSTGQQLNLPDLQAAFLRLGQRPQALLDMLREMMFHLGSTDVLYHLHKALQKYDDASLYAQIFEQLDPVAQAVAILIAQKFGLGSSEAVRRVAQLTGRPKVAAGTLYKAKDRLIRQGLLASFLGGPDTWVDSGFGEYVARRVCSTQEKAP